ncbi:FAD/NAD(P)-binding domain-containing protein [Aspergillus ellipticus CBS 707.79]|uniref:FAD/NAD(P)-binding domain-containing protein n=1 Tax=Aspergillus ellipticus CBS 707.79 TaxID=1448320 RepID=A0A319CTY1_9EURO|nr:FAD/NAD(P)-binding domain-containing protein [Aspergillus ellipticus CBS 707.79]
MPNQLVIIGAGFAGIWSAFAAKRLAQLTNNTANLEVLIIAPEPSLVIRPRLYEANPSTMQHDLTALFQSLDVKYLQGLATTISPSTHTITMQPPTGSPLTIPYDRLILAAGSTIHYPPSVPGLSTHAFNIDTLPSATTLSTHLANLPTLPASPARSTIVIIGAGFTGIELATSLPSRLSQLHLPQPQIILIDSAPTIASSLGPSFNPTITKALTSLHITLHLNTTLTSITPTSVTLSSGVPIPTNTVIWTAGVRATPLTHQLPSKKDPLSRLHVDAYLRVPDVSDIYATGDAACAVADEKGHVALMSCQHALQMGRVSGHNAAAELLGEPLVEYTQETYVCCLDLGDWGAVVGEGWERRASLVGDVAKRVKRYINCPLIYPLGTPEEVLGDAAPTGRNSGELLRMILGRVA